MIQILLIIFISIGCKSDLEKKKVDILTEKYIAPLNKKSIVTDSVKQIVSYTAPKTIRELLSTVYIADTLYWKINSNGLGNDGDTYELIISDLIAIDLEKNREGNKKIFTYEPFPNFKSNYEFEENHYITHCIDSECDQVVISKWTQTDNSLTYIGNFKTTFGQKYGRTQINDIIKINNELYFLLEIIQPDEGHELFRTIYVMKELIDFNFEIIDSREITEPHGEFQGSCKFELNSNDLNVRSQIEGLDVNFKIDIKSR